MIKVLVADDNAVIRSGLISLLEGSGSVEVVAEAATGREAVSLARRHHPDVVLLDVRMPVMNGLEAAEPLAGFANVLMLTYSEEPETVTAAIQAGACGYLVHGRFTPAELIQAVEDVAAGRNVLSPAVTPIVFDALRTGGLPDTPSTPTTPPGMTAREIEIMNLLAQGRSNTDIATTLFISLKTVKNHINRIYAKLHAANRAEAIAIWLGTRPDD
jgi:DNA-binding NarL/FixJ family response regulator